MNGPHDMGGMQCYGPVVPEPDEPVFHHDWERKALALTVAMGATGCWNIDVSRHARESLEPAQYLSSTYYEIWTAALEKLLVRYDLVNISELETGKVEAKGRAVKNVPDGEQIAISLHQRHPYERPAKTGPLFALGDVVRSLNLNPKGHTRLPQYAHGKTGTVERVAGCHVFPDSNAHENGEDAQWLYTIGFEASDLFGGKADHIVLVDCWEPYLERG